MDYLHFQAKAAQYHARGRSIPWAFSQININIDQMNLGRGRSAGKRDRVCQGGKQRQNVASASLASRFADGSQNVKLPSSYCSQALQVQGWFVRRPRSFSAAIMPTMAGRQRPIEKFAEAVGKCTVEVSLQLRVFSLPF